MTRRNNDKHAMKPRAVQGRRSRSRIPAEMLPLSVLRQVTGGEEANRAIIIIISPSPPPPERG